MFKKVLLRNLTNIWLLIFICYELVHQSIGQRTYHNKCFDVDHRNICYFMVNDTRTDWQSVWNTCKEMNATLPVISNTNVQEVIKNYLRHNVSKTCVWTAGGYIVDNKWRWVNGHPLKDEAGLFQDISLGRRGGIYAILNSNLKYEARSWTDSNDYICQLSGVHCNSDKTFSWKGGCLVVSSEKLNYKEARHACLQEGGDLATFTDDGDLQLLSTRLDRRKNYWIGLQQNLLIWNASGNSEDFEYKFLDTNDRTENGCLLFIVPGYYLKLTSCSDRKRFVCQTEDTQRKTEKQNSAFEYIQQTTAETKSVFADFDSMSQKPNNVFDSMAINIITGGFVGSLLLLFFVSLIIIFGRKTHSRRGAKVGADTKNIYEDLKKSGMAAADQDRYTVFLPTQQGQNVPGNQDPFYETL